MNAGEVEAHVVAALRARRAGQVDHTPVPSRDVLVDSIRLAHASAARRAVRLTRRAA